MIDLKGFKFDFETPNNLSLVLAAVLVIIEVYAPISKSSLIIGQYANTRTNQMEQSDIIDAILLRISPEEAIRILIVSDNLRASVARGTHFLGKDLSDEEYFYRFFYKKDKAILFVDSLGAFQRLKADLVSERFRVQRDGFFCIIYTGREPNRFDIIREIFHQLYKIFAINVNVLVESKEIVYVYTCFPFTPKKCANTDPSLYDKFGPLTNYTFKNERFFSQKLENLWGCKIRLTTWTEPPFIFVKYDNNTGKFIRLEGIEGMLMMLLASRMNFTIDLVKEPNNNRGYHLANGTATGSMKMIIDGETDIFMATLTYDKGRVQVLEPAYSYLSIPLSMGIPKGRLMTPFERLYRPFKYIIWSCCSSSIIFGILIIFVLKAFFGRRVQEFVFGHGNRIPFTNLWNIFYGGSITARNLPRRNFSRYLLGVWIFYTWILRTAYIGQLFIILQDSRGRTALDTLEELLRLNYTIYTYPVFVPFLKNSTNSSIDIKFVDDKENSFNNLFKTLGEDDNSKSAITVLTPFIRYYNQNQRNQRRRVNILKEPLLSSPITFYMRKHSFLAYGFHENLLNIMSAGLITQFSKFYLKDYNENELQEPALISIWLLFGIFSLYTCFLLLSTLIFFLELWSTHSPLTKKFGRITSLHSRTAVLSYFKVVMSILANHTPYFVDSKNSSLVFATIWLITKVLPLKYRGTTSIGQYADIREAHLEHNDLMEAILTEISKTTTTRFLVECHNSADDREDQLYKFYNELNDDEYFYRFNANRKRSIWLVDSLSSFTRLEKYLLNERNHFDRTAFYCIIYTGREDDRLGTLRTIFQRLFMSYIINVNVFLPMNQMVFVYTYFPFTKTSCYNMNPYFYGVIGPNTIYGFSDEEFFPRKITNMWGCKVNVTAWTELPFIDLEFDKKTGELLKLDGIEGNLLKLLANHLNFTITIVESSVNRGGNGTDPGGIKMLKDGRTNITCASLIHEKTREDVVRGSYTYFHIPLNLVMPFGKTMTPLERLIRPFRVIIWTCLSSSIFCGLIVIFVLKAFFKRKLQEFVFGRGNRRPFTNLWSVLYGVPISGTLPRRNFARYILGMWLFYTLILRSAYLAQLFFILKDSRTHREFNTLNDTLDHNFTYYSYAIAFPVLAGAATSKISIKMLESHSLDDLITIITETDDPKIAVTVLGSVVQSYNQNPKNFDNQLVTLPEAILTASISLFMRKHSYLAKRIDDDILNAMSSGLIQKFENSGLYSGMKISRKVVTFHSMPLFLLTGLLWVHLSLLTLSVMIFLLEILSKSSPLTKRIIEIFNY